VNLYPAKVSSVLAQTDPLTLALVGTATLISFAWDAARDPRGLAAGGWLDQTLPAFTFLQATPYFFLALLAIELFR